MQFIDLKAQYCTLKDRIDTRIASVLNEGNFIMGPEVMELEKQLSEYTGVKHTISCANGTDALQLALMANGVGPGDVVFTTPFTFFATAETISLVGATPVFVDINPDTFNLDPDRLKEAIITNNAGTAKAVISVDLFGLPADYPRLETICRDHDLILIEDAAQGFGGAIDGRRAGSFGDVATTSFFPAKPLGCYGDGGAMFTDDDALADLLRSLRFHGKGEEKYDNVRVGLNSRLDTLQAAILIEKLAAFPKEAEARQKLADYYTGCLKGRFQTPVVPKGYQSIWAQYSLIAKDGEERARFQSSCKSQGIPTMVYYPQPLHLLGAFEHMGYNIGDYPVSEDVASRIFSLPMHPYMKDETAEKVVGCLLGTI